MARARSIAPFSRPSHGTARAWGGSGCPRSSGRTTLLFSHLSERHLVFAKDDANSVSAVRASALLWSDRVTFVEGPTQRTLPAHEFEGSFQVVLIDGPHGYPFPDLEYYYFYPHLDAGGLLILDDTRIPSISRMLEIVKADPMFELIETVRDTAFLKRTDAPTIDPCGDHWWLQGYNRSYYDESLPPAGHTRVSGVLGRLSRVTPQSVKDAVPAGLRKALRKRM
jgi:hypothetical protein